MNELNIPPAAQEDENSIEMLRVWIAQKGLHCSLRIGMYEEKADASEEKAWGIILADAVRHISDGLESGYKKNYADTLQAICRHFNDEISKPTSRMRGEFIKEH
ncbi:MULTISPECIES: DUF5076 domain-containing protein [Lysobacter]|uniref:DUF5076 domain-containing protein n=1 Tax=Lysobacter TaxID=68 RepID=UPI001F2F9193|nr:MULTISPECIES: DUF5076 domain-containing protein [Lysobacter]UJB19299.1 DUF5076 domain-containing protein [Lysobacter capsici]UJQ26976.1 DUF5076 domain-containing protein [Lysobacter gummosus]